MCPAGKHPPLQSAPDPCCTRAPAARPAGRGAPTSAISSRLCCTMPASSGWGRPSGCAAATACRHGQEAPACACNMLQGRPECARCGGAHWWRAPPSLAQGRGIPRPARHAPIARKRHDPRQTPAASSSSRPSATRPGGSGRRPCLAEQLCRLCWVLCCVAVPLCCRSQDRLERVGLGAAVQCRAGQADKQGSERGPHAAGLCTFWQGLSGPPAGATQSCSRGRRQPARAARCRPACAARSAAAHCCRTSSRTRMTSDYPACTLK